MTEQKVGACQEGFARWTNAITLDVCQHADTTESTRHCDSHSAKHVRNAMLMVFDLQSGICYTLPPQLSADQPSPPSLQHYRYHLLASGFNGNIIKGMQSMT